MELSLTQLSILMQALNDREGVLSGDYLRAQQASSDALLEKVRGDLKELRAVADVLRTEERRLQEELLDNFNYVGSRHHY